MVFVLQGTGQIRIGENTYPVRSGDVIACPAGGKETAHQIINSGADELRYLAVSTKLSPEIAEYPDFGEFGLLPEFPAGPDGNPQRFVVVGWASDSCNYWESE